TFAAWPGRRGDRVNHRGRRCRLLHCMSPVVADFVAKVFFALVIKISFGCTREFRVMSCSSTSSVVGYRWAPSSRLPMARSASGKPSKRYGHARAASAAGCTRPPLNKLPKSQQSKAKRALQEIWMAETKKDALL